MYVCWYMFAKASFEHFRFYLMSSCANFISTICDIISSLIIYNPRQYPQWDAITYQQQSQSGNYDKRQLLRRDNVYPHAIIIQIKRRTPHTIYLEWICKHSSETYNPIITVDSYINLMIFILPHEPPWVCSHIYHTSHLYNSINARHLSIFFSKVFWSKVRWSWCRFSRSKVVHPKRSVLVVGSVTFIAALLPLSLSNKFAPSNKFSRNLIVASYFRVLSGRCHSLHLHDGDRRSRQVGVQDGIRVVGAWLQCRSRQYLALSIFVLS